MSSLASSLTLPKVSSSFARTLINKLLFPLTATGFSRRMAPLPLSPTSLLQPAPKLSSEQLKLSTAQLYSDPNPPSLAKLVDPSTHSGPWAFARAKLDYTYHKFPSKERQA